MLAWFRRVGARVDKADQAFTERIGRLPRSGVDSGLKLLTTSANHSLLWFSIAAVLAARRGVTRRAALRGVLAIGGASFTANVLAKPLLPRRRPAADALPGWRALPDPPTSSSFPSGHAASAAAFATAVGMECPAAGAALAPLAATVAYSRVHTGVHWPSDVLAGAVLGAGIAVATQRWWPPRPPAPAKARPHADAPALPAGDGLMLFTNQRAGTGLATTDPAEQMTALLPAARTLSLDGGADGALPGDRDAGLASDLNIDIASRLLAAVDGTTLAIGVAGGDGSVAAAAAVAVEKRLPLAVVPAGTLNHFARDIGIASPADTAAALEAGNAVAVDLATVVVDGNTHRPFVNTASLGGYPDLVRLRERWRHRLGKWPAAALALVKVLAAAQPLLVRIDGRPLKIWLLFVGNGPYHPAGMAPAWRPALDTGLLDVRYIRADLPLARTRFVLAALTSALHHSRTYVQRTSSTLEVWVHGHPVALATDGEVRLEGNAFTFAVHPARLTVYRPDEAT